MQDPKVREKAMATCMKNMGSHTLCRTRMFNTNAIKPASNTKNTNFQVGESPKFSVMNPKLSTFY